MSASATPWPAASSTRLIRTVVGGALLCPLAPTERRSSVSRTRRVAVAWSQRAAVDLGHVEDVGHTRAFGVDFREVDGERELVHRLSEREEKSLAIFGDDLR